MFSGAWDSYPGSLGFKNSPVKVLPSRMLLRTSVEMLKTSSRSRNAEMPAAKTWGVSHHGEDSGFVPHLRRVLDGLWKKPHSTCRRLVSNDRHEVDGLAHWIKLQTFYFLWLPFVFALPLSLRPNTVSKDGVSINNPLHDAVPIHSPPPMPLLALPLFVFANVYLGWVGYMFINRRSLISFAEETKLARLQTLLDWRQQNAIMLHDLDTRNICSSQPFPCTRYHVEKHEGGCAPWRIHLTSSPWGVHHIG